MSSDHYFSQEPKSEYQPKQIELDVAGEVFKVSTASGTFSPLRLDVGTSVLIDHLELAPKDGNILDLGCGWGAIALNLAKHSPKAKVWAVDVNNRSLELTAENTRFGSKRDELLWNLVKPANSNRKEGASRVTSWLAASLGEKRICIFGSSEESWLRFAAEMADRNTG
jgi:16S rRNA G1207 methylase RsmC